MDSLPNRNRKLDIVVGEIEWNNREYSGTLPNNFECNLTVAVDGKICFEESISVGELFIQLNQWHALLEGGLVQGFQHSSVDLDGDTVFAVRPKSDSEGWEFVIFDSECPTILLRESVVIFLLGKLRDDIHSQILERFGELDIRW